MKHRVLFGLVGALCLAGCAGDRQAIVSACVEQGETAEKCGCMADVAQDNLPAETFSALADISRADGDASPKFLQNMSIDEAAGLAAVALEAGQTCRIAGLNWLLP